VGPPAPPIHELLIAFVAFWIGMVFGQAQAERKTQPFSWRRQLSAALPAALALFAAIEVLAIIGRRSSWDTALLDLLASALVCFLFALSGFQFQWEERLISRSRARSSRDCNAD
jgi:hypothetical protein